MPSTATPTNAGYTLQPATTSPTASPTKYPTVVLAVSQPVLALITGTTPVGKNGPIRLSASQSKGASAIAPFIRVKWLLLAASSPQPLIEQALLALSAAKELEVNLGSEYLKNISETLTLTFALELTSAAGANSSAQFNFTVLYQYSPRLIFSDNTVQFHVDPAKRWSMQVISQCSKRSQWFV
jgi:hypothetical protein